MWPRESRVLVSGRLAGDADRVRSETDSAEPTSCAHHVARHVIAVFDGVANRLLSRHYGCDRNAEPADAVDEVTAQPFGGLFGQRRDDDFVEVVLAHRLLDSRVRVGAADQMIDGPASRSAQEWDGDFQRPVGRLARSDVRNQQCELGRLRLGSKSDLIQEPRRRCGSIRHDQDPFC